MRLVFQLELVMLSAYYVTRKVNHDVLQRKKDLHLKFSIRLDLVEMVFCCACTDLPAYSFIQERQSFDSRIVCAVYLCKTMWQR